MRSRSPLFNPVLWIVAVFVLPEVVKKCKPFAKIVGDTLVSAGGVFLKAAEAPPAEAAPAEAAPAAAAPAAPSEVEPAEPSEPSHVEDPEPTDPGPATKSRKRHEA
jgi:hypothetical protein